MSLNCSIHIKNEKTLSFFSEAALLSKRFFECEDYILLTSYKKDKLDLRVTLRFYAAQSFKQ